VTAPDPLDRPLQPWRAAPGCTTSGCTNQPATVDLHHGRRCAAHPPQFLPTEAVDLLLAGWVYTAAAYCRSWCQEAAA